MVGTLQHVEDDPGVERNPVSIEVPLCERDDGDDPARGPRLIARTEMSQPRLARRRAQKECGGERDLA